MGPRAQGRLDAAARAAGGRAGRRAGGPVPAQGVAPGALVQVVFPGESVGNNCWQNLIVAFVGVAFTLASIPLLRR